MRRRLLIVLLVFAALAVHGFVIPLCATVSTSRTQELWLSRYVYAGWFADLAEKSMAHGDRQELLDEMKRYGDLYSERVLVIDANGAEFANTGVDTTAPAVADVLVAVRSNRHATRPPHRLRTWDPDTMLIAAPIGSGLQISGAVVIEASAVRAKAEITQHWALIVLGSWTALALFTGLALALSRWILRPLSRLSHSVARLTDTIPDATDTADDPPVPPAYEGPPEIRELARSFDAMATTVSDSVRAQRQLVADTAHAIRNPLAALAIRLQAMEKVIPEQAEASFRRVDSQVDRLTAVLNDLLTLTAAETPAGFDPPQTDSDCCDVVRVVTDRVDEWRLAFDRARMTLSAEPTTAVIEAELPTDALERILDVALSNSCRYAGPGTHTEVRIRAESPWVTVSVIDNGIGVPAAEIVKLTTRFFRGSSATPGGSGLGLPIAAALAQRHRGELSIDPTVPHGLRVAVRMPLA